MTMRVQHQRVGVVAPAGAERARDRRRDAAAHRAGRQHLHQHEAGKHQRHAGERVGAELATNQVSIRPVEACASITRMFGQASRSSVGTIGAVQQRAGARAHARPVRGRAADRSGRCAGQVATLIGGPLPAARLRDAWLPAASAAIARSGAACARRAAGPAANA